MSMMPPATARNSASPASIRRDADDSSFGRPQVSPPPPSGSLTTTPSTSRLVSLDAYRGFIMLAMASGGLGFSLVAQKPEVLEHFTGTMWDGAWRNLWRTLAYQFDHVAWTGCGFWDLIQPSFMFMVGVSLPFSNARRRLDGQSNWGRFGHVLWRSAILVFLGVFLSSNGRSLTNFTFVNVLTQIGLGYPLLYLVSEKYGDTSRTSRWLQLQFAAAIVILVGYWGWFAWYSTPADELTQLQEVVLSTPKKTEAEFDQFSGLAAHWNKHTNAAAAADRILLNWLPREGEPRFERRFWFNDGGYQTLNFIPSLATMIFGLMAGQVLRDERPAREKLQWLLWAGLWCFLLVLPLDPTIWPWPLSKLGFQWSLCPTVKRIWTPTWAVFSSGWTFWMLAAFYWVIDMRGWRRWSWPLVVVGMNSITMYVMSQLMRSWTKGSLKTHLATIDTWAGWERGLGYYLFDDAFAYAPICERTAVLFMLWLACVWLYRQKIFVRI